jgi:hypothetical protein
MTEATNAEKGDNEVVKAAKAELARIEEELKAIDEERKELLAEKRIYNGIINKL